MGGGTDGQRGVLTISIVDTLGILSDNPDHGSLGLRLVQGLKIGAQGGNDALVPVGVLAEDVLDDDDGLLHNVVDLGLDKVEEHLDAALGSLLELDGAASDGAHGLAHELDIDFCRILLELHQHLLDVAFGCEHDHDLELLHLHVDRVVVLAEEHLKRVY